MYSQLKNSELILEIHEDDSHKKGDHLIRLDVYIIGVKVLVS